MSATHHRFSLTDCLPANLGDSCVLEVPAAEGEDDESRMAELIGALQRRGYTVKPRFSESTRTHDLHCNRSRHQ